MCLQYSRVGLSPDEQLAAKQSLALYCKPLEFYNFIQRHTTRNPFFLQRCLNYKIQARRKKRIQITISLSGSTDSELQAHNIFPLYVLLARPTSNVLPEGHSSIYRFNRVCILASFSEFGDKDNTSTFIIPDVKNLSNSHACNLNIILISCEQARQTIGEDNCSGSHLERRSLQKLQGKCFWGNIPIALLASSLENCVKLSLGHIVKLDFTVKMRPSFLEPGFLEQDNCLTFCNHKADATGSYELQGCISAQEAGARDMSKSPYSSYTYNDVPPSSLSHIIRLRSGNVLFNYKYYNNMMQETEVTEDFSCSICLVKCGSFKGLAFHLNSSHDLFHFEFLVSEKYQAVNVSLNIDGWRIEVVCVRGIMLFVGLGVEQWNQPFFYSSRSKKRMQLETTSEKIKHVYPHIMESGSPEQALLGPEHDSAPMFSHQEAQAGPENYSVAMVSHKEDQVGPEIDSLPMILHEESEVGPENDSVSIWSPEKEAQVGPENESEPRKNGPASVDPAHSLHDSDLSQSTELQFGKSRKLSFDRADPRKQQLLRKRFFFHSHKGQQMALEEVLSDVDSEDEVDDDIADLEDRRTLADFADVTNNEKLIMHMWNSFARKQRLLADGHVPWTCEAFTRFHGAQLVKDPGLLWCWRLFMIKLWNHNLLDARTMDKCNTILQGFQDESSGPK
ncbi:hypothetical protein ACP4OV_008197 [Aristida adscensionis]